MEKIRKQMITQKTTDVPDVTDVHRQTNTELRRIVTHTVLARKKHINGWIRLKYLYLTGASSHSIRAEYVRIWKDCLGQIQVLRHELAPLRRIYPNPFWPFSYLEGSWGIFRCIHIHFLYEWFTGSWTCPTSTNMPQSLPIRFEKILKDPELVLLEKNYKWGKSGAIFTASFLLEPYKWLSPNC